MSRFLQLFKGSKCAVLGMIHVKALPDTSPKFHYQQQWGNLKVFNRITSRPVHSDHGLYVEICSGSFVGQQALMKGTPKSSLSVEQLIDCACKEALIYKKCHVDGVIVENMFDVPYVMGNAVGPEVTAVMTRVCSEVKKSLGDMPCGVQVLSGNNFCATAVALAAGLQFVRTESFVFAHVADEGLMQACAGPLLRYAKNIGANLLYFTDIKKKHSSHAITQDVDLCHMAKAAEFFLSDGVILTGLETGDPPNPTDLKDVQNAVKLPVLIGSGVTDANVKNYAHADALIVGSYFKSNGNWMGNLDSNRILNFMEKVQLIR